MDVSCSRFWLVKKDCMLENLKKYSIILASNSPRRKELLEGLGIEYKVKTEVDKIVISGYMYAYGAILNAGVKADNIPFSPRGLGFKASGAGTSLYIKALQNYAKQRMGISDEQKSLSVAFAIATTQKKYGMPTSASTFYSSTGKRTEFISDAFKNNEDKITEVVETMAFTMLTVKLDTLIDTWNIELNR